MLKYTTSNIPTLKNLVHTSWECFKWPKIGFFWHFFCPKCVVTDIADDVEMTESHTDRSIAICKRGRKTLLKSHKKTHKNKKILQKTKFHSNWTDYD